MPNNGYKPFKYIMHLLFVFHLLSGFRGKLNQKSQSNLIDMLPSGKRIKKAREPAEKRKGRHCGYQQKKQERVCLCARIYNINQPIPIHIERMLKR